jgi:hypothetical protein
VRIDDCLLFREADPWYSPDRLCVDSRSTYFVIIKAPSAVDRKYREARTINVGQARYGPPEIPSW